MRQNSLNSLSLNSLIPAQLSSEIGVFTARQKATNRQLLGTQIILGGKSYAATTRSLEKREHEYVPDGLRNAAAADLRVFAVSPSDFVVKDVTAWPEAGAALSWHGMDYTLILAVPGDDEIGGVMGTLRLIAYRAPAPDSATDESGTGKRKTYWPTPQA